MEIPKQPRAYSKLEGHSLKSEIGGPLPRSMLPQLIESREVELVSARCSSLLGVVKYSTSYKKKMLDIKPVTNDLQSILSARCAEAMLAQNMWE